MLQELLRAKRYYKHIRINIFFYYYHFKPLTKNMIKEFDFTRHKFNTYKLKAAYFRHINAEEKRRDQATRRRKLKERRN